MTHQTFAASVEAFNNMYRLPVNTVPTVKVEDLNRLQAFRRILDKELSESKDIEPFFVEQEFTFEAQLEALVALADWLGDIIVYCRSEAMRYGIPLEDVLKIIMDSNMSKLGSDGLPIYDDDGKVCKGPNYWKPEPKIRALLLAKLNEGKEVV